MTENEKNIRDAYRRMTVSTAIYNPLEAYRDLWFLVKNATYTDAEIESGAKRQQEVDLAGHLLSELVESEKKKL